MALVDTQSGLEHRILEILQHYVSPPTAKGMLRCAYRDAHVSPGALRSKDLPKVVSALGPGIRMYLTEGMRRAVRAELDRLLGDGKGLQRVTLPIRSEMDACRARSFARSMCEHMGARSLLCQRVATGVSELTRNILNYVGEGMVTLDPVAEEPRRMIVQATDSGPGIADLELVLSGRYQSKTGLGRGLAGVRSLADEFDIQTDGNGTRVTFGVYL